VSRVSFGFALIAAGVACGARTPLAEDGAGGTAATGGQGSAGPEGGAGDGGEGDGGSIRPPTGCETLAWAGDPVLVPWAGGETLSALEFVQIERGPLVLTFNVSTDFSSEVASVVIDAWGAWPPVPPPAIRHSTGSGGTQPVAVALGKPGFFAYAARDVRSRMGIFVGAPDDEVVIQHVLPLTGEAQFLERGQDGASLLGHGASGLLEISLVPDLPSVQQPQSVDATGCASSRILADAVTQSDGSYLVASSNNDPFDDCVDPDIPGPPRFVQIARVDPDGSVSNGSFHELDTAIRRLQLVPRPGGALLLHRAQDDAVMHISEIDSAGFSTPVHESNGNAHYGDAIASWRQGYAHVTTWPQTPDNDTDKFVSLDVQQASFYAQAFSNQQAPVQVEEVDPTLIVSSDERSFLVAWLWDEATVALMRADCAERPF